MRHSTTFIVVIESDHGRKSRSVGPYHSKEKADNDAASFITKDRRVWVEPVHTPEQFRANPELPVSIGH